MRSPLDRFSGLSSWQLNALGLIGCAMLAVAWYLAGFSPLAEARAARQALDGDLTAKREAVAHLKSMQTAHTQSLEKIKTEASAKSVPFQPVERSLDRISQLSKAASGAWLSVDEIKPGQPIAKERFTTVPIHLSGTGEFPGVASLLHALREQFPDTAVGGIDLRGEPEHPDKPGKFTLDLVWYAAKLSAAPAQKEPGTRK